VDGAGEEVEIKDGVMEGLDEVEGEVDGTADDVGIREGREEIVGRKDKLGLDEADGTAEGTPRLSSHLMSILF